MLGLGQRCPFNMPDAHMHNSGTLGSDRVRAASDYNPVVICKVLLDAVAKYVLHPGNQVSLLYQGVDLRIHLFE